MIIDFIKQRKDNDCVLACMAMASGLGYEETLERFTKFDKNNELDVGGIHLPTEIEFLKTLGMKPVLKRYPQLFFGKLHLITVPSLNYVGLNHSIVVNSKGHDHELEVYDPSRKKQYKTLEDLKGFSEVIIIN